MRGRLREIAFFILLAMILMACGVKIVPKSPPEGIIDQKALSIEKEGVRLTVEPMAWRFFPYYLEDYYTPLYIIIRNGTDKPVAVKYEDFILFDDKGNQFKPILPEKIEDSVGLYPYDYPFYSPYYNPWYWGYRPYWWPYWSPYWTWLYYYGDYRYPYDRYYAPPLEIVPQALPEGEIYPGAQVRGFLYFQNATEYGKGLTLKVSIAGLLYEFGFEIR